MVEDDGPTTRFNRAVAIVTERQFDREGLRFISQQVVVDAEAGGNVVQLGL